MPGVPTLFNAMLNHPAIKSSDLSSLRFCLSGGAPLPVEVKQQFEASPAAKVVEGYGLSEASPVVDLQSDRRASRSPAPSDRRFPVRSFRCATSPIRREEVPQGETGELCVKGPQVMKGYWKKPEETAEAVRRRLSAHRRRRDHGRGGFLLIVDRIKDLIICSGYNVYPRRIEEAIYEHPAVEEVTVIGIKDAYRGEAPKAFIKLKAGMTATAEDILKHLEPKISKIEIAGRNRVSRRACRRR